MMLRRALFLALLILFACRRESESPPSGSEQTYKLTGKIVTRDPSSKHFVTDHDAIPGFMEAMTMTYEMRGADGSAIPPEGSRFEATLHVRGSEYWVTDVKSVP